MQTKQAPDWESSYSTCRQRPVAGDLSLVTLLLSGGTFPLPAGAPLLSWHHPNTQPKRVWSPEARTQAVPAGGSC